MIIALATDRHFVELAGVLIRSICSRGEVPQAKIVLLSDGLTLKDKQNIQACSDRPLVIIDAQEAKRRLKGLKTKLNWPLSAYLRLLVPDLITDTGRMLYLDCDIVVNDALGPLFEVNLGENPLAARYDKGDFFNAGVLLIDLEKWREEKITERTLAWAREKGESLKFPDQDSLNAIVGSRFVPLDRRWNLWWDGTHDYETAAIIHFTKRVKPNYAQCQNPARLVYLEQRSHTPWRDAPLVSKSAAVFRRHIRKLRRIFARAVWSCPKPP